VSPRIAARFEHRPRIGIMAVLGLLFHLASR
jgi:hypothetical protein